MAQRYDRDFKLYAVKLVVEDGKKIAIQRKKWLF